MINFRYHVVSIVAVFLALGIGVLVGTTVVDRFTLDFLEREVQRADAAVTETQRENAELREDLRRQQELWERWMEESGPKLLSGRLEDVPVLVLSVEGVDEDAIEELRTALADTSARYEGVVRFTERVRLESDQDVEELGALVGTSATDADAVRRSLVTDLAAELRRRTSEPSTEGEESELEEESPTSPSLLANLLDAGFAEYQGPGSDAPDESALPLDGTRLVVVGGPEAAVPAGDLLAPLVRELAAEGTAPLVAAVAGPSADADEEQAEAALAFVTALREDVADRVSTVDNLGDFPGQAATVLALEDLASGVIGHYGVADGAEGLLPPDSP